MTDGGGDGLWYKDAVIYQLHVRAFADSDADGIGDFAGLTEKLDYLQDLGVTAIWLLPFYPSPLKDDGYDIADYTAIHPSYGTLADFRRFLREAHKRGLRVINELVLNHTSDQHPWFRRARRAAPGTPSRDFYVWSDTPDGYAEARIIFKDFESSNWAWDPVAQAYYWHRFYSHQPDLNFENPDVWRAMFKTVDFWLGMGVDGMRLDAVPYLFEREGTNCENLPETYDALRELRRHVDSRFPAKMLLAEANQWPEDAVAYFGDGDECHMAFHFPLMPRMFMAIRMEDRFPVLDILAQTPQIPDICQWALFLRNHDELTLEMVTDEERDYMYRVYAQDPQARINLGIRRRLAPLLGNNRRLIEMMNALLFSLPGTPVIYYGDEIGMGDNIYLGDRNGVRTPMQWNSGRNAGFSRANPQKLYLPVIIDPEYNAAAINVESQQNNAHSLLWWTKRLIALRKRYRAFGRGSLEFLYPENRKVLAFLRRYRDELILVVANLSRFVQYAELDLSAFRGMVPVELFGQTEFPPIGDLPYFMTLSPHAFYWFALEPQRVVDIQPTEIELPTLEVTGAWEEVFTSRARHDLEQLLPQYLASRRWFGGKARRIKSTEVVEAIEVPADDAGAATNGGPAGIVTLVRVEYAEGDPETYVLPLSATRGPRGQELGARMAPLARLLSREGEQFLFDGVADAAFANAIFDAIARRRRLRSNEGQLRAWSTRGLRRLDDADADPRVHEGEQSNTSIVYGDRTILKLFRRPEEGVNPDLEVGRFLTERRFRHTPPVAGAIEYRRGRGHTMTIGILQGFVPNQGDAWTYTLGTLRGFYSRIGRAGRTPAADGAPLLDLVDRRTPDGIRDAIGDYLSAARLLGRRTAELHRVLATETEDTAFAPEPFTTLYQRSMYQSMRGLTRSVLHRLPRRLVRDVPELSRLLELEEAILRRFQDVMSLKIDATRIRCHGDYHLGQVLRTGRDFVIIDFEGEPALPLSARRIKRSPLRDVAGMIRSFHYAAYTGLEQAGPRRRPKLQPWAAEWYAWVAAAYLRGYLAAAEGASFLPKTREEREVLLDSFLLEKAIYEVGYESSHRPDWVHLPVRAVMQLLGEPL